MGIGGSCHCGAVTIAVPAPPSTVVQCNCSLCRKLGWLVAYYDRAEVSIEGETEPYMTGEKWMKFRHCRQCGVTIHWEPAPGYEDRGLGPDELAFLTSKIGVNARLLDGFGVSDAGPTFDGQPLAIRFHDNSG